MCIINIPETLNKKKSKSQKLLPEIFVSRAWLTRTTEKKASISKPPLFRSSELQSLNVDRGSKSKPSCFRSVSFRPDNERNRSDLVPRCDLDLMNRGFIMMERKKDERPFEVGFIKNCSLSAIIIFKFLMRDLIVMISSEILREFFEKYVL